MTAEEKLKELKEALKKGPPPGEPAFYPVRISPKDIDLIANLVVERIKENRDGELF